MPRARSDRCDAASVSKGGPRLAGRPDALRAVASNRGRFRLLEASVPTGRCSPLRFSGFTSAPDASLPAESLPTPGAATCGNVESDDEGDDGPKGKGPGNKVTEWNNKCSPNATGICKTYNFKDAVHPKKHLYRDGTCKFRHVCNHWVTGKGKDGVCGGDHPYYSCTNPDRTTTRPT